MRIATLMAVLLTTGAQAATLEVRGRLTDGRGQPQDGACLLRFHVSGPSVESPDAWSDAIYVEVEEGLFRATLGRDRPIPDAVLGGDFHVAAEAPKGTGWQALASPLNEPTHRAAHAKKTEAPPAAPPDETARLKARIEALEKQLPTEPKARTARIYEVKAGDTLQSIAAKLWGDSSRWSELYSANADRLARGGDVASGQKLVVPEVDR